MRVFFHMVFMARSFHKLVLVFLTPPRPTTGPVVPLIAVRPLDTVLTSIIVAVITPVPIPGAVVVTLVFVIEVIVEIIVLSVQPAVETTVLTPGVRMFMKFLVQGAEVLMFLFM
jgi:hypothetical protein